MKGRQRNKMIEIES